MRMIVAMVTTAAALVAGAGELKVSVLPGEGWWGGATRFGKREPFGLNAKSCSFDLRKTNDGKSIYLPSVKQLFGYQK